VLCARTRAVSMLDLTLGVGDRLFCRFFMEIHSLTISERITLAEALWDSVTAEDAEIDVTARQREELGCRLAAFESDQDIGAPWSAVKERILSR